LTLVDAAPGICCPAGVFVNAEQVAGPTPALDRRYDDGADH
jgi:tRNA (cmo5U34)-methyltransferase